MGSSRAAADIAGHDAIPRAFLVRNPVFDTSKTVQGYELLGRSTSMIGAGIDTSGQLTRQIIHEALCVVGLEDLIGPARLFLKVVPQTLLDEDHLTLPADRTILELHASVESRPELLSACHKARRDGYTLALSDCVTGSFTNPLFDLVEMVRIDFQQNDASEDAHRQAASTGRTLLAGGVDTLAAFARAQALNCRYVQGFFFCQPETVSSRTLSAGEMACFRLMSELNCPQIDLQRVETCIKNDVALMCRLLKYINSVSLGVRQHITSVGQALRLLGERPLRKWASIATLAELGRSKPEELLVTSLVRAHFCERLAELQGPGNRGFDAFLVGLLSLLDVITDMPMEQAIAQMPLNDDVRSALLGDGASALAPIHALACACERGAWATVSALCIKTRLTQHEAATAYYDALRRIREP